MLDSWQQDVRYAARLLRRNPLFALTAAASVAIGIGANTTIFTVASALLFKTPVGVVEPGRLVDVGRSQDGSGFDNGSYPNYLDVRARNTMFTDIYAYKLGADLHFQQSGQCGAATADELLHRAADRQPLSLWHRESTSILQEHRQCFKPAYAGYGVYYYRRHSLSRGAERRQSHSGRRRKPAAEADIELRSRTVGR